MKTIRFLGAISILLGISCSRGPSSEAESSVAGSSDSLTLSEKEEIQTFWTHYRQATKDRIAGSWQEAAAGYTRAIELNDRHEDALYYLGNMYLELAEYPQAEECWSRLLEVNPSSPRAHFQLGKLYLNLDAENFFNLDQAADKFQKTIEVNKDFLQPVLHLAQISLIRGDYADCKEKLEVVLGSNEKSIEALFLLGYLAFKQGDPERAVLSFKKARELSKPQAPTQDVKGEGDTKTGKSLERAINQSIFSEYFKDLKLQDGVIEDEMKLSYSRLNDFITQLQDL